MIWLSLRRLVPGIAQVAIQRGASALLIAVLVLLCLGSQAGVGPDAAHAAAGPSIDAAKYNYDAEVGPALSHSPGSSGSLAPRAGSIGAIAASRAVGHVYGGARSLLAPTSAADDLLSAACRTNSFVPGTEVLMADGTTRPIEEIEIGDWVWAHDPETGEAGPRRVIDTIVGDGNKHVVEVGLLGDTIIATDGHPFWVTNDGAWIDAGDLEAGDRLMLADGRTTPITAIDERVSVQRVYNLTVDGIHTYYVQAGDEQVLVHNCRPEAGILGSKKHGVDWTEGPARARSTGLPQGQWAADDLALATDAASGLGPRQSGYFDLPAGSQSIVHLPDGTTVQATGFWVRNNGTGTWHGYPTP